MTQDAVGAFANRSVRPTNAAAAQLKPVGASVVGKVVATFFTHVNDRNSFDKKQPKKDVNGNILYQVIITLQTSLRNWEAVELLQNGQPMIPVDEKGQALPPSEDTGLRTVFCKYKMMDAVGQALLDCNAPDPTTLPIGCDLFIRHHKDVDSGKDNPLPDFEAKIRLAPPPAPADGAFAQPQAAPPVQQPVVQQAPPAPQPAAQPPPPPAVAPSDPWGAPPAQASAATAWPEPDW